MLENVPDKGETPHPFIPLPTRSSRGEGMFLGFGNPGWRTSEKGSKRVDVLTLG